MIKVIFVDQSAGMVEVSLLNDLIAEGKIAAFCGPIGWTDVNEVQVDAFAKEYNNPEEGEKA